MITMKNNSETGSYKFTKKFKKEVIRNKFKPRAKTVFEADRDIPFIEAAANTEILYIQKQLATHLKAIKRRGEKLTAEQSALQPEIEQMKKLSELYDNYLSMLYAKLTEEAE